MSELLPGSFIVLQYIGLWQPVHWQTGWKTRFYTIYMIFSVALFHFDTISHVIQVISVAKTAAEFASHSFILITMFGICGKHASLIGNRKKITELVKTLTTGSFRTGNPEEEEVRRQFETNMKWRTIIFMIFMQMGTVNLLIHSLVSHMHVSKMYMPWDSTTTIGFWATWFIQFISRICAGPCIVASDTLAAGFLFRIAVQFHILQFRVRSLTSLYELNENNANTRRIEMKKTVDLVKEHREIIKCVQTVNDVFGFFIASQYFVSSVVLCLTVFSFSQVRVFNFHTAVFITYTCCLYFQIFILCSAGSEMTEQSSNFATYIYTSNWEELQITTKKSLLLMMVRSYKPLKFTSFGVIELSMASFSQIVKFSYSAYNVLARGQ